MSQKAFSHGGQADLRLPYGPKFRATAWSTAFFGASFVVLVYKAINNDRGDVLFGFGLSPAAATIYAWLVALGSFLFFLWFVFLCFLSQRRDHLDLVISGRQLCLPVGRLRRKPVTIDLASLTVVRQTKIPWQRFLELRCAEKRHVLVGEWLPTKSDFAIVVNAIRERIGPAR